nr:transposase [Desulfomonile tiedjei]
MANTALMCFVFQSSTMLLQLRVCTRIFSRQLYKWEARSGHKGSGIFRENEERLYHWARDRTVPTENSLAERDLRPSVVARKVSYGSISDNGAKTCSILTTVLTTLKKRGSDPTEQIKKTLDRLATNLKPDPYELLFQRSGPQE